MRISNSQHTLGSTKAPNKDDQYTTWTGPHADPNDSNNRLVLIAKVPDPDSCERGKTFHVTICDQTAKGFFTSAQAPIVMNHKTAKVRLTWKNVTKKDCPTKQRHRHLIKVANKAIIGLCRHSDCWEKSTGSPTSIALNRGRDLTLLQARHKMTGSIL